MLHSGSRNIGKALAEHHMQIARKLQHNQALEDRDLAVFLAGTPEFAAYRRDLFWAQEYARCNREVMLALCSRTSCASSGPRSGFEPAISCHHNYVAEERHFGEELLVTRKGAIRARAGELGIIPGSMGTKSYIVRGRGNAGVVRFGVARRRPPHEPDRRRASASRSRTCAQQTEGVECRKDAGVLDEAPGAYKDIDQVMAQQSDLVEIVAELKQILCVKG